MRYSDLKCADLLENESEISRSQMCNLAILLESDSDCKSNLDCSKLYLVWIVEPFQMRRLRCMSKLERS